MLGVLEKKVRASQPLTNYCSSMFGRKVRQKYAADKALRCQALRELLPGVHGSVLAGSQGC